MQDSLDACLHTSFSSSEELLTEEDINSGPSTLTMTLGNGYSPPEFDFSVPCRGFKSTFARSLSLSIAGGNGNWGNGNCCKSLDYNVNNLNSNNSIQHIKRNNNRNLAFAQKDCPPLLPQRLSCAATTTTTKTMTSTPNIKGTGDGNANGSKRKHVSKNEASIETAVSITPMEPISSSSSTSTSTSPSPCASPPPPVLPARRSTLTAVGRKNACETQTPRAFQRTAAALTHFNHRQPTVMMTTTTMTPTTMTGNNHVADADGGDNVEPAISTSMSIHADNFRRNNEQQLLDVCRRGVDKSNHNVYQHGHLHQHQHRHQHHHDDNNHGEQNCSIILADHEPKMSLTPALPPKKHQQQQQTQTRTNQRGQPLTLSTMKSIVHASLMPPVYEPVGQKHQEQGQGQRQEQQECKADLENVILQNELHMSRWQLKQMDTRCEMQRAVLEEMARFLDRYHVHTQRKSKEQQRINMKQEIPRSKSLFHVNGIDSGRSSSNSNTSINEKENAIKEAIPSNYLRARSSTNLIDVKTNYAQSVSSRFSTQGVGGGDGGEKNSYSAFKDYTWRRSPKKPSNRATNELTMDEVDLKLSQEAFRLSRTIHNLLNGAIQQPPLNGSGRLVKAPSSISIITLDQNAPNIHNSTTLTMMAGVPSLSINHSELQDTDIVDQSIMSEQMNDKTSKPIIVNSISNRIESVATLQTPLTADINFLRAHDLRDSRLSMRSSTDSSVHSLTSSSTDEDTGLSLYHPNGPPASLLTPKQLQFQQQQQQHHHLALHQRPTPVHASTTEDESGFSSISSFQEIGLPITPVPTKVKASQKPQQLQVQHTWNGNANGNAKLKANNHTEDPVLWV